ncbi:selenoprotein [Vibrio ishigakensis]|nr:selenoprotein [Vibrio ishigakensis]
MDHVINWHFPKLKGRKDRFKLFLSEVVKRTAKMIAGWQAYGFYHGVMNTDNMSILGQTFDYGPYAFIEQYQPNFVGNHTDYEGRYAFNRQPGIAHWNLSALGYALSSVLEKDDIEVVLASYVDEVQAQYTG